MSQPRPASAALNSHYPRKPKYEWKELFESIGWQDLYDNYAYVNTCAVRVSIALLSVGYNFPGRMRIKAGPLKGRMIEPGHAALSKILARPSQLDKPEIFKSQAAALQGVGRRQGIVSFFNIDTFDPNNRQGHIDLVGPQTGGLACAGGCFWHARETWFWPLK